MIELRSQYIQHYFECDVTQDSKQLPSSIYWLLNLPKYSSKASYEVVAQRSVLYPQTFLGMAVNITTMYMSGTEGPLHDWWHCQKNVAPRLAIKVPKILFPAWAKVFTNLFPNKLGSSTSLKQFYL